MRKLVFSIIIFSLCKVAFSQHELSLGLGGGLSGLNYDMTIGSQSLGLGGQIGWGYKYFFTPNLGIGTGIDFALYNSKATIPELGTRFNAIDLDGLPFEFRSTITNFEEKQRAVMLQIPIMAHLQSGMFYGGLGAKIGVPVSSKFNGDVSLRNSGYYALEDYEYVDRQFMGFGTFNDKYDGEYKLKTAIMLSAEFGIKRTLRRNENMSIYAGIYVDYGLNNIRNESGRLTPVVDYNNAQPNNFVYNGISNSYHNSQPVVSAQQAIVNKINPIAVGVVVRLAFGKTKRSDEPVTQEDDDCLERLAAAAEELERLQEEAERLAADNARLQEENANRPQEPQPQEPQPQQPQQPAGEFDDAIEALRMNSVYGYVISRSDLNASRISTLEEITEFLKRHSDLRFHLYGHTCDLGNDDINRRVGLARANEVRTYMLANGIAASRIISVESKLDREPVVPNTSEENRKRNRRVEVLVVMP